MDSLSNFDLLNEHEFDSLIEKDFSFEGTFSSDSNVLLNGGKIVGLITIRDSIFFKEGSYGEGEISAKNILVRSSVKGTLRALERLELGSEAKVEGNMHSKELVVLKGAKIHGFFEIDG